MTVAIDSDSANIAAIRFTEQGSDPPNPSAGGWKLYFKSGGQYFVDSGGVVSQLFTDPMSAEGDLVYRHSGAATRLPVGSAGKVLLSNGTDPAWSTPDFTLETSAPDFKVTGLTGAVQPSRLAGATTAGAPVSGTFAVGDRVMDYTGVEWLCTAAGSPGTWTSTSNNTTSINVGMKNGGLVIGAGVVIDLSIDYNFVFQSVTLLADMIGSVVLDVQACTYAGFDGSFASIVAAAPPTISGAVKSKDAVLAGWTTSFAAGSIMRVIVSSCSSITRLTAEFNIARVP